MATNYETDIVSTLNTLEESGNKLHLVSDESEWQGSLTATQPQAFTSPVCVWEEGSWPIHITTVSKQSDGITWGAFEMINLESSVDSGRLIRDRDSRTIGEATPLPNLVTVFPECSGKSIASNFMQHIL